MAMECLFAVHMGTELNEVCVDNTHGSDDVADETNVPRNIPIRCR